MKNKCVKNIWIILLLLLIYPINVKAAESECTYDQGIARGDYIKSVKVVYPVNVGKDYTNASSIKEITTSKKKQPVIVFMNK